MDKAAERLIVDFYEIISYIFATFTPTKEKRMLKFPFACLQHELAKGTEVVYEINKDFTCSVINLLELSDHEYYDPLYLYYTLIMAFGPQYLFQIVVAIADLKQQGYLTESTLTFEEMNQRRELIGVPPTFIKVHLLSKKRTS